MATAVILAVGALVFYGLNDIAYKRGAQAGASAQHLLLVQSGIVMWLFLAYGTFTGSLNTDPIGIVGAAVAALFSFAGFYNFVASMRTGAVSVVAPVVRLNFVFTALLAVLFLDERITGFKIVGLAAAVTAVWLLLAGGPRATTVASKALYVRVAVAFACIGMVNFLFKFFLSAGATTGSLLFYQVTSLASISAIATLRMNGSLRIGQVALRHGAIAAAPISIGFVCIAEGLARGEATVIVPVSQLGFVFAALVGVAFLKEPLTARKIAGLVAAAIAVAAFGYAAT